MKRKRRIFGGILVLALILGAGGSLVRAADLSGTEQVETELQETEEPAVDIPTEENIDSPSFEENSQNQTDCSEPVSETESEGRKETEMMPETEEKINETETPETHETPDSFDNQGSSVPPEKGGTDETGKVYLNLDNRHIFDDMSQSYSKGYEPTVSETSVTLVVPFTAEGKLKDDKLTVDLEFQENANAPFAFKNYQKDVEKKTYEFDRTGTCTKEADKVCETEEVYLYRCKLLLLPDRTPGQYPVVVKAWGYTENGEKVQLDYCIYIRVEEKSQGDVVQIGPEEAGQTGDGGYGGGFGGGSEDTEEVIHQPKILLESFRLSGGKLEAGNTEDLNVAFQNRSTSQQMYNLKITVSTEAKGIRLGKNSFYFSSVSPGEEISLDNKLEVTRDAPAGQVPLTFYFEYEDSKGTPLTGSESLELTVAQPVWMELETGELPTVVYASETVELPVKAINVSRAGVYNVRIKLSGMGLFPKGDVYLGNLEPGTSGDGAMKVYVGTKTMTAIGEDEGTEESQKYGPVTGTFTLSYEDGEGNPYEVSREYHTEIKKAQILSLKVVEEETETNGWEYSLFMVAVLALLICVVLLLDRLRRKERLLKETMGGER